MNIYLNTVLVIQSILRVHAELKLKPLNISQYSKIKHFENLEKVEPNFLGLNLKNKDLILLYGSQTNNSEIINQKILKNVTFYHKATTHFDRPLINF